MSHSFQQVAKTLCEFDLKILATTKHLLANDLIGMVKIEGINNQGTLHRQAGAVFHVLHCTPVNITLRESSFCSQVMPANTV